MSKWLIFNVANDINDGQIFKAASNDDIKNSSNFLEEYGYKAVQCSDSIFLEAITFRKKPRLLNNQIVLNNNNLIITRKDQLMAQREDILKQFNDHINNSGKNNLESFISYRDYVKNFDTYNFNNFPIGYSLEDYFETNSIPYISRLQII